MNQALMWCDTNTSRTLADKVLAAAARHVAKFGVSPTVCYVNAAELNGEREVNGIELKPGTKQYPIPKWHLVIGVKNK